MESWVETSSTRFRARTWVSFTSFTALSSAGGNVHLLSSQYSPTMTMSVWPALPAPHLSLFATIPRIWTRYRTRPNTSATNQGWAPFWFARTPTGGKKSKRLPPAPGSKWRTIFPSISPKRDKTSYWKCIHDTFNVLCRAPSSPVCNPPSPPGPRVQKKSWGWPLLLLNTCFVAQENVSASVAENTGECINASWAWKVWLFHFLPLCVTHSDRCRTPLPIVPFLLAPVLLFKEVFKGKRL